MVYVDMDMCKSCGLCMKNCPGNVFEFSAHVNKKGYNYARAVNMDRCIGCRICEKTCPDFAIYVER